MRWLYNILDIGKGTQAALEDASTVRGGFAMGLTLFLDTLLLILFVWGWWVYDLHSTWQWAGPLGEGWTTKLPAEIQPYNQWLIFILNVAPTLIQWRYPNLARKHAAAFWIFAASAIFDIVTDYPAVRGDIDTYLGPILGQLGIFTLPMTWGAYLIGTVVASFVLQSLVVIQFVRVIALALGGGRSAQRAVIVDE